MKQEYYATLELVRDRVSSRLSTYLFSGVDSTIAEFVSVSIARSVAKITMPRATQRYGELIWLELYDRAEDSRYKRPYGERLYRRRSYGFNNERRGW